MALIVDDEGGQWLCGAPYSSTCCSSLYLIALPHGEATQLPLRDTGACVVAGPDGHLYLGTASGSIMRVDPTKMMLEQIAQPLMGNTFDVAFAGAGGSLYFSSLTVETVVEYIPGNETLLRHPFAARAFLDIAEGRVAAFGDEGQVFVMTPGVVEQGSRRAIEGLSFDRHIATVAALDADSFVVVTSPGDRVYRVDGRTFRLLEELPALPENDTVYCLRKVGDDLLASGALTGSLYRWFGDNWDRLATPTPYDPLQFTALPDGRIAGLTYHGRLLQSTFDWRMYSVMAAPTRMPEGMHVRAMGIGPDRQLYFTAGRNMRISRWNPEDNELGEQFVAVPYPGELSVFGFVGERLLMAFSHACGVMAYYPDMPYRLLDNPIVLGLADTGPHRPVGPMVHYGRDVYFATTPLDDPANGTIIRLDPSKNQLTAFPEVIPGQGLSSLVADRLDDLLVAGGIDRGIDGASVAVWSPLEERTIAVHTPLPGAACVRVWAAGGGRAYLSDGGSRFAVLDIASGEVVKAGEFPLGTITALLSTLNGDFYGLAGGWFFHLDVEEMLIERLAEATGELLTEVRRDLFVYTHQGRLYKAQVW